MPIISPKIAPNADTKEHKIDNPIIFMQPQMLNPTVCTILQIRTIGIIVKHPAVTNSQNKKMTRPTMLTICLNLSIVTSIPQDI